MNERTVATLPDCAGLDLVVRALPAGVDHRDEDTCECVASLDTDDAWHATPAAVSELRRVLARWDSAVPVGWTVDTDGVLRDHAGRHRTSVHDLDPLLWWLLLVALGLHKAGEPGWGEWPP